MKCKRCRKTAAVALPSHHAAFCPECFLVFFERQVAAAIKTFQMCSRDDRILVAVSGGKDSLALAWQLQRLNLNVSALHLDLGIADSSTVARAHTESMCRQFGIDLHVVEFADLKMAIPDVKARIKRPICSVCGRLKRHVFNRYALENGFDVLATGHNLDDETARLLSNTLRWDTDYLAGQSPSLPGDPGFARKIKPLCQLTEYETAALCFLAGLNYGHQPCPYSPGATFTRYKILLNNLEDDQPGRKRSFYSQYLRQARPVFERLREDRSTPAIAPCQGCGSPTTAGLCSVCRIREAMDLEPLTIIPSSKSKTPCP
ncbi:MAG: adenine nucleotide alpha hydrolase family protein [Deltaproteobacteria bacterium]|nr:adenine nucleotide alpha hydrolase family protein [Deltaproteobacteria bacterium]